MMTANSPASLVRSSDDACCKVVGYLLACAPATVSELRGELLEQCQYVDKSNVNQVLDATLRHLVSVGAITLDDGQYEFADSAFDVNGNYVGPYADES